MIDVTKEYTTRDGRKVTQLTYFEGVNISFPIIGVVEDRIVKWTEDGKYYQNGYESGDDLVETKPTKWVNVYNGGDGPYDVFDSKEEADLSDEKTFLHRIACIPFKEGDGL